MYSFADQAVSSNLSTLDYTLLPNPHEGWGSGLDISSENEVLELVSRGFQDCGQVLSLLLEMKSWSWFPEDMSRPDPQPSIEPITTAVLNCFSEVTFIDIGAIVEISNGAGDFDDSMKCSCGEIHRFNSSIQQ